MVLYQRLVAAAVFCVFVGTYGGRAPHFVQEPQNAIASKAKPLTLNCSADGFPQPHIEWYKDGERLILDSRRSQLDSGALHFNRVIHKRGNKPDVGTYHCLARNPQGIILSGRVAVKVAALSKRFLEQPQNTSVWQGMNVRFTCRVEKAVPVAMASWDKDGIPIDSSNARFTLLPEGVLQITNAQPTDEGNYRCTLSNGLRHRQSQYGSLEVLAGAPAKNYGPHIVAPAFNVTVIEGQNAVLECFATGFPLPTLTWQRLEKKLIISQDPSRQSNKVGVLNWRMASVSISYEGRYQCSATSRGHTVTASVWLFVKAPPHFVTKPVDKKPKYGHPVTLSCRAGGSPLPKLTWFKNGSAMQYNNKKYDLHKGSSTSTSKSSVLNLLILGVDYEDSGLYQCFAENDMGSIQATASLQVQVADNRPGSPQNVVAQVRSSSSVRVSWSPPFGNFTLVAYTVYCKDLDHKDITERQEVVDGDKTSYTYESLHGYTNYSFHVIAFSKSIGLPSKMVSVRTLTAKPSAPPLNLSVISNTPDSLDVKWIQPPTIFLNGLTIQYIIQYHEAGSDTLMTHSVPGTIQQTTIRGLTRGATYVVKVAAATSAGEGPFCETVKGTVKTDSKPPVSKCIPSAPKNVTCAPQGPNSFSVTWEKPPAQQHIAYFEVSYRIKGSSYVKQQEVYEETITLKGLHHGTVYTIAIKCRYGSADSCVLPLDTTQKDCKTDEIEPKSAPSNIKVTYKTSASVDITWDRPALPNGEISSYEVLYSRNVNLPIKQWKKQEETIFVIRDTCETGLAGLLPNATYFVCVRAVTSRGVGPESTVYTIPMQWSDVVMNSVPNTKIAHSSGASVEVSWPVQGNTKGKLRGYTLQYALDVELTETVWKKKLIEMNFVLKLSETLIFQPGKSYKIWVRAEFWHSISGPWSKNKFVIGRLPKPTVPGSSSGDVDMDSQFEQGKDADDKFSVKLGIIIGCIVSAFFTVVLVLFIIWRNPCRQQRRSRVCKGKSDQAMDAFLPNGVPLQISVSGSQGQSASYEEASLSSGVCQCRCTCGAGNRRTPYMSKPLDPAVRKDRMSHAHPRVYDLQGGLTQGSNTSEVLMHSTGGLSSSSVSVDMVSDGRTRTHLVSRLQKQSVSVDV